VHPENHIRVETKQVAGFAGIGEHGPKQNADQLYHAHGEAVLSGWKASIVAAQSGADKKRKCL
jgi:hypothetical protein